MADKKCAEGTALAVSAGTILECVLQRFQQSHGMAGQSVPALLISTSETTAREVPPVPEEGSLSEPRSQSTRCGHRSAKIKAAKEQKTPISCRKSNPS